MKKSIIFIGVFLFANDTKEILNLIKDLHKQTFSYVEVSNLYNPFTNTKTNTYQTKPIKIIQPKITNIKYKLEAIFQQKVKINGNWYKNHDKLDEYTIIISQNKVYLKNNKNIIDLTKKQTLLKVEG